MYRNLSPVVRQKVENHDEDVYTQKSAMKEVRSYSGYCVSNAIQQSSTQPSETENFRTSKEEYAISLFEHLARIYGTRIVPQIGNIMSSVIKSLSSGYLPLQQACSRVVSAIAWHSIDPMALECEKSEIVHSLCKPLSDALLSSKEGLSSGAALCLRDLVYSGNWIYLSDDIVNQICLNVTLVLEDNPMPATMGLVMGLVKHNSLIIEAYSRVMLHAGLRIIKAGNLETNSIKRIYAIQMVNLLMKCLHPRNICEEVECMTGKMEKLQYKENGHVKVEERCTTHSNPLDVEDKDEQDGISCVTDTRVGHEDPPDSYGRLESMSSTRKSFRADVEEWNREKIIFKPILALFIVFAAVIVSFLWPSCHKGLVVVPT